MNLTTYTIEDAEVHHVNGDSTSKELWLNVTVPTEDSDGAFVANQQIHVPVPFNTPLGDKPDLIGKKITLTLHS